MFSLLCFWFSWKFATLQHCDFLSKAPQYLYHHCLICPPPTANAALPPHPLLQAFYSPSTRFVAPPSVSFPLSYISGCYFSLSLPPLTCLGLFSGMLEVFEPAALNFSTLSHFILSTISVSWNPLSTRLPLSGFLATLVYNLIALSPSLAFFLLMTWMSAVISTFSSDMAFLFLNSPSPLSFRLASALIMLGSRSH